MPWAKGRCQTTEPPRDPLLLLLLFKGGQITISNYRILVLKDNWKIISYVSIALQMSLKKKKIQRREVRSSLIASVKELICGKPKL